MGVSVTDVRRERIPLLWSTVRVSPAVTLLSLAQTQYVVVPSGHESEGQVDANNGSFSRPSLFEFANCS